MKCSVILKALEPLEYLGVTCQLNLVWDFNR